MRKTVSVLLLILLLVVSSCSTKPQTKTKLSAFVDEIAEKVKTNWTKMNQVWPSYKYDEHNLILVYEETAYSINAKGHKELSKEEVSQLRVPNPGG